jgi:hypothetical protein
MVVRRLVDGSPDVLAAVQLDAAGNLVAASEQDSNRARELADLARRLVEQADAASDEPVEQIEAQVGAGSVYATRSASHVIACVTKRLALSALVLYDMGHALAELERSG